MNEATHISFISTFLIIEICYKIENENAGNWYCNHFLEILLVFK